MRDANRNPIDQILVATDFSTTAAAGLAWAQEIARDHGAAIRLVHALLLPNAMTDFLPSPPDLTEELRVAANRRLEETVSEVRAAGLEATGEVRLGLASEAIVEATRETRPDLVVVGTRGHSGLRHLLLGSTAERVVQRAPAPVLTVHPGDADHHRRIRTILLPTDFSTDAENAAETALDLLAGVTEPARLILLHAYHLPYEYTVYGTIPTSFDYRQDVGGASAARLEEVAEPLRSKGLSVETRSCEGYPPEVIVAEAESLGADLISMGTHGRSGLAHLVMGSTAERVVQHAPCPVLTVRRHDD